MRRADSMYLSVAVILSVVVTAGAPAARAQVTDCDFNGDGIGDMPVGVPNDMVSGIAGAGAVNVFYGTNSGFSTQSDQIWTQDSSGIANAADVNEHFGAAVVAGYFNDDVFCDLAIGVPNQTIGGQQGAGAVHVIYGSANGLDSSNDQFWHLDHPSIQGVAEADDFFGAALIASDYNNDGLDDLVIGFPGEDTIAEDAGAFVILFSAPGGLSGAHQFWSQSITGVDQDEEGDSFGAVFTAADFDMDGFNDLAVGATEEDIGTKWDAGAVTVFYGSSLGLSTIGAQFWHQDVAGVPGTCVRHDRLGTALTVGDFNQDGFPDLAAGIPGDNVSGEDDAGAVLVLYSSMNGLASAGSQLWTQASAGIGDVPEAGDMFGSSLCGGDFNHDFFDDLAIGAPGECVGAKDDAGIVHAIYSSPTGLDSGGSQVWNFADAGQGVNKANNAFGAALGEGDFDDDGIKDLCVGVPGRNIGGDPKAGAMIVYFGSNSGLTAAGAQLWSQDSGGVAGVADPLDAFGSALDQ